MIKPMPEAAIRQVFADQRAIIVGNHFVYKSGLHGEVYVNKDAAYTSYAAISTLCGQIALHARDLNVDVVIGPAIGGIVLSQWTAYHLSRLTGRVINAVFAEKPNRSGSLVIKRGYDALVRGHRTLIAHDHSVDRTEANALMASIDQLKGVPVGICDVARYDAAIQSDALKVYATPNDIFGRCKQFAERNQNLNVDVVLGISNTGAILSQWMANHLSEVTGHVAHAVFAEYVQQDGAFAFPEGYARLVKGKRALVVEDVLTTGTSARSVVELARSAGATVVAVGALANRGKVTAERLGVDRLRSLIEIDAETWPAPCPRCLQGVPINVELGHGRTYVAEHGQPQAQATG